MAETFRTTEIRMDSSAFVQLMETARFTGVYDNRREAREDCYQEIVELLCEYFHETQG